MNAGIDPEVLAIGDLSYNQEKSRNKILRLLSEGRIAWHTPKDVSTPSAEAQGLGYEQPREAEVASKGSGITPQANTLSVRKSG